MHSNFKAALVFLWLVFGPNVMAQQAVTSATVAVRTVDETGSALPMAKVSISNLDRNQNWKSTSDVTGRSRFLYLPVGAYELAVESLGFARYGAKLTLSVGQSLDVTVILKLASLTEHVNVLEEIPLVEVTRTQLAATIAPAEIEDSPLNGRNFMDLALLVPGVSKTNTGNNERFAETSAVPGTGISVAGQRNLANTFIVDGLSANDDAADLAGTFFSPEVIREFQVVTSGGIAEFGRASSGVMNIVTQSGSNDWRGKLYGFFRNQRFDATNVFAPVDAIGNKRIRTPLTQSQYGASLGGPLRRDRTFLFANYEREDLNRSGFVTISPSSVAAINDVITRTGYPPGPITTGSYPTGDDRSSFFSKIDFNLGHNHRLATRYNAYDIDSPNARGVGGLIAVSRGTSVGTLDQNISVNDIVSLSPTSVNEIRAQYVRSRLKAPGNDLVGPSVTISGVASFGASTSSPTARNIDMVEIANNFSTLRGAHLLKVGADFINNRVTIEFPATVYGTYFFSSLSNFQQGLYTSFGQAFGRTNWAQSNTSVAWFLQDEWRAHKNLTINAGLRHDIEWLDANIETGKGVLSPRFGLAYSPGDHKTVVRLGMGLYYDRIPLRAVANALRGAGVEYKAITLQRTQVGAPAFPNKLGAVLPGVLINLTTIDPNIKNSNSIQANLQIEHAVTTRTSVELGYVRTRGLHIIMQRNLNVPALPAAEDPVNLGRPNPDFANINQYSGQGDSYYDGMTLSVQHRSTWAAARLSYTLSKAIDNTGNAFFSGPQDNFNLRNDRGPSDNDQRHRLTVSGRISVPDRAGSNALYEILEGFQLSPIFTYASGYPFNIVTGAQTLQTTAARRAGTGRNTGRGFNYSSLDIRVSREFHPTEGVVMEIMAEAFNALNRVNRQFPNNTWGTGVAPAASFGTPTAAGDPRQIQFGIELAF